MCLVEDQCATGARLSCACRLSQDFVLHSTAFCGCHVMHCRLPDSNVVLVDMPGLGGIEHECKIARHYITASKSEFVLAGRLT